MYSFLCIKFCVHVYSVSVAVRAYGEHVSVCVGGGGGEGRDSL